MSERTEGYASAVVAIAQAEDVLDRVTEELSAVGRTAAENEELRRVLTDLTVPASRRTRHHRGPAGCAGVASHPQRGDDAGRRRPRR